MSMKTALRLHRALICAATLGFLFGGLDVPAPRNTNKYFVLDNGLQVVLYEKHGTPLVNMSLAVNLGSKDETKGSYGVAHLLEHCLLFRGRGTPDEARTIGGFRRNGAYFNGYTSQDLTIYEISLPSGRADFGLSTQKEVFSDIEMTLEELDREKDIILEEIGTLHDDPRRFAASLVYENLFPGHAYGNPLFGDEETIRAATPEAIRSMHRAFYVPSNSSLAVVGDFALAEMEQKVRTVFGGLQGPPVIPALIPKAKILGKSVEIRKEMDVKEAYLAIGLVGPDYNHPDQYPAELLTEILGRGLNPMLNVALRARRDLVKSVSMSYAALKFGGVFIALFTLDPRDVSQARSEARAFLKKARSLNFGKDDYYGDDQVFAFDFLRGAKNQIKFGGQKGRESGLHLASSFARHILLAENKHETEGFLAKIEKVSSTDLRKIAARYLNQGESVVVAIVPGKES
jgi:zinc protease